MTSRLFNPNSDEPFTLSRSRVDNFIECQRCFYLTNRLGIARPSTFPFNLNNAVDELLKNEFDGYRKEQKPHPIQKENNLNAIPYEHPDLDDWRESLRKGVKRFHEPTNLLLRGGVDDIWIDTKTNQLIVVDYKATSKKGEVSLDADWQIGYKRQVEFYQWLFTKKKFDVSPTAYFVFCSAFYKDIENFNEELKFKIEILTYEGDYSWVDDTIIEIKKTLDNEEAPNSNTNCKYCIYRNSEI